MKVVGLEAIRSSGSGAALDAELSERKVLVYKNGGGREACWKGRRRGSEDGSAGLKDLWGKHLGRCSRCGRDSDRAALLRDVGLEVTLHD